MGPNFDPGNPKIIYFSSVSNHFSKNRFSKLISIFDPILAPTWLHFGSQNPPKSRLGGFLGRLQSVLEASWAVLGASWSVLGSSWNVLEASWSVLGASWSVLERLGPENSVQEATFIRRGGGRPAQLGRREPPIFKTQRTYTERLPIQEDYLQKNYICRVSVESKCRE